MAALTQNEIDRRKEETFRINENLDLAEKLFQSGEWEHALAKYQLIINQTDPQTGTSGFYRRARQGAARCLAAMAISKEEQGALVEAAGYIRQATQMDPQNVALARRAKTMEERAAQLSSSSPEKNPEDLKNLISNTEQIKKLLSLADQKIETGQLRSARKTLDDVLRIDPYHRVARQKIEQVEDLRMRSADLRYQASREKALAQVTEAWLPPPPAKVQDVRLARSTDGASVSSAADILKALASITIPELSLNEEPIRSAVDQLQRLSEQNDPAKKGINFVLKLPPATAGRNPEDANVSLELREISLQVALKYLCEQVRGGDKLRYEVENNAVFLLPVTSAGGELETRNYDLPPSLIANLPKIAKEDSKSGRLEDPQKLGTDILRNIGVNVAVEGASAICFRDTGKLVVRNTPNELNKIEQRLRDAQGEPPQRQFAVETKFLQFTDNDVKNFTFNLSMQTYQNNGIPGTGTFQPGTPGQIYLPPSLGGGTDGLRGTAGLNANGVSVVALQSLLDPSYPQDASNQVGVNAQILGRGFSAFVQLLQNAIGRDLVAAPRVTLADGKPSKIIVSREMWYPTTYTQPTVPNNDQGVGAGFILPSTPSGFERRDIGVTLMVKGESTSVPQAVDLDFTDLLVTDFEGFVNYGATIATVTQGQGGDLNPGIPTVAPVTQAVGQSPYLVPIFSRKSLQSRVRLWDGDTVGLGGLISESVQLVDDKVPGLGDLPLVGRAFRSKASQKVKSNLVIFCTLRIINPDGSPTYGEDVNNLEFAQNQGAELMPSVP